MSATTTTSPNPAPPDLFKLDVHTTREAWLVAAANELWPMVTKAGGRRPEVFRVSCGWPSKSPLRRASAKTRRIGECWSGGSADGAREVFISPALAHPVEVMDVLLHEMIHAALPEGSGHGPAFARVMKVVGLEGKPTATVAGDELVEELKRLGSRLGRYPHAKLDPEPKSKQTTRMMKVECPDCGYTLRATRTWIEVGVPTCPCGTTMESIEYTSEGEPLDLLEAVVSYATKDGRFELSTSRNGRRESRWIVRENFRPALDEEGEEVVRQYVTTDGEVMTELSTEPSDRWAMRVNRVDALAFIAAVREGLTDFPESVHEHDDEVELDDEVGDWSATDADLYLDDDEDEEYDSPEDELTPEELEEFERVAALRDASGSKKSLQIIEAGGEGAMD